MTPLMVQPGTARRPRAQLGMSIVETLMAMTVVLVVTGGLASFVAASARANAINAMAVQVLSSARSTIEHVQSMPYEQVGIQASAGDTGPGYFVVDPYETPEYDPANGDILLSDETVLEGGLTVTRTVTVTATDDPADGTGAADFDGVTDPNTGTVMDYKTVAVTARAQVGRLVLTQTLRTIIRGTLPEESDGSTGEDSNGDPPKKPKKVSKKKKTAPGLDGDGDASAPPKKSPAKKK